MCPQPYSLPFDPEQTNLHLRQLSTPLSSLPRFLLCSTLTQLDFLLTGVLLTRPVSHPGKRGEGSVGAAARGGGAAAERGVRMRGARRAHVRTGPRLIRVRWAR